MGMEMSMKGAHQMITPLKEDLWDFNNSVANVTNQVESIWVEDVLWCWSRITTLEKPNNPANKLLWQLINWLSCWIKDQADQIGTLQAGMIGVKERTSVLEMSLLMIQSQVSTLEEAMEIDPLLTDLTLDDSTDSEYRDVDDGGAMLVDDSEDEWENMPPPPALIQVNTPHPVVLWELIPIEEPAPVTLAIEVFKGEDDVWYIPPVMCRQIHTLDEYSSAIVDPVLDYVEDYREDLLAGPHREDLAVDGSEDELWAILGVNLRSTE
jgi:hypothetical protein